MSTSIDDLFKAHSTNGTKRKFESSRNADEVHKAIKVSTNGTSRHATVINEEDDDGAEAGPALPPDEDIADDEEGRFFGGGISKDTVDVLDYLDEQDGADAAEPEKIDAAWLRRLALNFERRISKNAELRAKYEDDPQKFMASEGDLDADLKALSILTDHPELYPEFAKLGCVTSLVSLLAHENTDIAIDAIELISELTDEDVQAQQSDWDSIVTALVDADLSNLLTQNLTRLDESQDTDRNGVYHTLSLIENLASQPNLISRLTTGNDLLKWLLFRIQQKESPIIVTQNKAYAAELLSILSQSAELVVVALLDLNTIDVFLTLLSSYRKRDPAKGSDEEEYVENIFNALTICVGVSRGKGLFLEAEGVELCLIMLKEGKFSKPRALRLLDHALAGFIVPELGEKFVEAAGLRTVGGMLGKKIDRGTTEHVLGIFASLFGQLPGDSAARIRVLAKFIDSEYDKVDKLLIIRQEYGSRLQPVDQQISAERKAVKTQHERDELEAEWQSRRLDAGLYLVQTANVILAWLAAEDAGARKRIVARLAEKDETLADVTRVLSELMIAVKGGNDEESKAAADMYETLIEVLK